MAAFNPNENDFLELLDAGLHQDNGFCNALEQIETLIGVPRTYFVCAVTTFFLALATWTIFQDFSGFLLILVGLVCPCYRLWQCLQDGDAEKEERWRKYFVVYVFFTFFTFLLEPWYGMYKLYRFFKIAFLSLFLFDNLGSTNAADFLYDNACETIQLDQISTCIDGTIRESPELNATITEAEELTGRSRNELFLGVLGLLWLIWSWKISRNLYGSVFMIVGYLYPGYHLWKSMKKGPASEEEKWKNYWMVLGCFKLTLFFADYWMYCKLYLLANVIFLAWCCYTSSETMQNGAMYMYYNVVNPFFAFFSFNARKMAILWNRERRIALRTGGGLDSIIKNTFLSMLSA